jgi:multiple sugar transport system ATP-binding protein
VATISLSKVVTTSSAPPLDLEIPNGCFAVLFGPKDRGNSSVLRAIAGLDKIAAGEIRIDDRRVNELAPKNRGVAMVFRDDSLYPRMTVRENLGFGLRRAGFVAAEIDKRIEEVAAALSIADLMGEKADNLSLVQSQRVAIGRAVVRQPKLLLFDHPFARLHLEDRMALRNDIAALHERSRTTSILASDVVEDAMSLGEMVAVLDRNELRAFAPPRALYERPENIFVAEFFGRLPMNLIRGQMREGRNGLRFHEAGSGTIEFGIPGSKNFDRETDKPITLGIRPEDIALADSVPATNEQGFAKFRAIAESVLPLGGETEIRFQTGAHSGICRIVNGMDRSQSGRRMEFMMSLEKTLFFDPDSGKII